MCNLLTWERPSMPRHLMHLSADAGCKHAVPMPWLNLPRPCSPECVPEAVFPRLCPRGRVPQTVSLLLYTAVFTSFPSCLAMSDRALGFGFDTLSTAMALARWLLSQGHNSHQLLETSLMPLWFVGWAVLVPCCPVCWIF